MENISSYVILYANKAAFLALPQGVILKSIFFYTVVVEQQFDEKLVNSQHVYLWFIGTVICS